MAHCKCTTLWLRVVRPKVLYRVVAKGVEDPSGTLSSSAVQLSVLTARACSVINGAAGTAVVYGVCVGGCVSVVGSEFVAVAVEVAVTGTMTMSGFKGHVSKKSSPTGPIFKAVCTASFTVNSVTQTRTAPLLRRRQRHQDTHSTADLPWMVAQGCGGSSGAVCPVGCAVSGVCTLRASCWCFVCSCGWVDVVSTLVCMGMVRNHPCTQQRARGDCA